MIEVDFTGFPEDNKLIEAIHVCSTLEHSVITLARMDTEYVQMVIDRLNLMETAVREPEDKQGLRAFTEALTKWLDTRSG